MHVQNQPLAPNGPVAVRGGVDGQRARSTLSAKHLLRCWTSHLACKRGLSRLLQPPHPFLFSLRLVATKREGWTRKISSAYGDGHGLSAGVRGGHTAGAIHATH
jgi:hypothetical protein